MATYYWQAEIPKNVDDNPYFYFTFIYINHCYSNIEYIEVQYINDFFDYIQNAFTNNNWGTFNYVITDNGSTWLVNATLEITGTLPECVPLWLNVNTAEQNNWSAAWTSTPNEITICDTCQDITLTNCDDIEFSFPITDALYQFSIEDHQSGAVYQQEITMTGGTGVWNQTNTSGVFTPFSVYTLTITDENGQPVSWTVGDIEYTCARITFVNTVDTNVVT